MVMLCPLKTITTEIYALGNSVLLAFFVHHDVGQNY
jgi:hypothetical protein